MTDELVEMARLAQRDDRMATGALYGDLADRIEELEAKLQSMALDCLAADGQASDAYQAQLAAEAKLATCEKYKAAYAERDRIGTQAVRDLEAKLEKALEGLRQSKEEIDNYIRWEYPSDHPVHERYRKRDFAANPARTTLAELKGKADE